MCPGPIRIFHGVIAIGRSLFEDLFPHCEGLPVCGVCVVICGGGRARAVDAWCGWC